MRPERPIIVEIPFSQEKAKRPSSHLNSPLNKVPLQRSPHKLTNLRKQHTIIELSPVAKYEHYGGVPCAAKSIAA